MKDSFVYIWENLTNGKKYVGYHKGKINDGYISSSHNKEFWKDFYDKNMIWKRKIVFYGTSNDCLKEEQEILRNVDLTTEEYYNNARGSDIIFTDGVRKKMSISGRNKWKNVDLEKEKERRRKISKSNKGKKRTEKVKKHLSKLYKNITFVERFGEERAKEIGNKISRANIGKKIHSDDWKNEQSIKMKGNQYGKLQTEGTRIKKRERFKSKENPGKNKSKETKNKISKSKKGIPSQMKGIKRKRVECPHCGKIGGEGIMNRWHFDNCKIKN